jgi:hypothetical protein
LPPPSAGPGRHRNVASHSLDAPTLAVHLKPSLKVISNQCTQSASFLERHGPLTAIAPPALGLGAHPAAHVAARLSMGVADEASEIVLETKRGSERFIAEAFTNGRLRFLLLYRHDLLAGRRLRIAAA